MLIIAGRAFAAVDGEISAVVAAPRLLGESSRRARRVSLCLRIRAEASDGGRASRVFLVHDDLRPPGGDWRALAGATFDWATPYDNGLVVANETLEMDNSSLAFGERNGVEFTVDWRGDCLCRSESDGGARRSFVAEATARMAQVFVHGRPGDDEASLKRVFESHFDLNARHQGPLETTPAGRLFRSEIVRCAFTIAA